MGRDGPTRAARAARRSSAHDGGTRPDDSLPKRAFRQTDRLADSGSGRRLQAKVARPNFFRLRLVASLAQQFADSGGALEPGVEFEIQFGGIAKTERAADLAADESGRALEPGHRSRRLHAALDMREADPPVPEVIGHGNAGEGDATQSGVLEISNQHRGEFPQHQLRHSLRSSSATHLLFPTARLTRGRAASRSAVDDLELFLSQGCQAQRLDEVHYLAQSAIDERAIASHLADAEFGALPHVVTV